MSPKFDFSRNFSVNLTLSVNLLSLSDWFENLITTHCNRNSQFSNKNKGIGRVAKKGSFSRLLLVVGGSLSSLSSKILLKGFCCCCCKSSFRFTLPCYSISNTSRYNQIEYVKYANLDCSHDVHTEERSLGCHLENTLFQYNNSFLAEERAFK